MVTLCFTKSYTICVYEAYVCVCVHVVFLDVFNICVKRQHMEPGTCLWILHHRATERMWGRLHYLEGLHQYLMGQSSPYLWHVNTHTHTCYTSAHAYSSVDLFHSLFVQHLVSLHAIGLMICGLLLMFSVYINLYSYTILQPLLNSSVTCFISCTIIVNFLGQVMHERKLCYPVSPLTPRNATFSVHYSISVVQKSAFSTWRTHIVDYLRESGLTVHSEAV